MSNISLRIETISLPSSPTTDSGQIDTPLDRRRAKGGSDPLSTPQRAAVIGDSVPIVFGRRVSGAGGVLVSPPASEARFTNNADNDVTASYLMVISEGLIDGIQVRDIFQQSCRVGVFTIAFDRRAGNWAPGNFITAQTGFEDQVPDCPIYCGSGTGSYAGMTTGSFVNTIPNGFTQWDRQVHVFVRGGMHVARQLESGTGPSNNVIDLFLWALERTSRVPAALIDTAALLEAARFTNTNGLWFNGLIDDPTNLADWVSGTLPYFLLRETRRNGKKGLRPLLPFIPSTGAINLGAVSWVRTFNEDSIIPGTFSITYAPRADRMPFCVQVMWRQQPEDGLGLARTAEVRYGGSALNGPYEQHDLSAFATTETHAFRVGAYILARRRYIDHRLSFKVRPGDVRDNLSPGDLVRVRLRRVASVGSNTLHDYLYEVDRIARTADGSVELELTHFPVDAEGRSLVARDVNEAVGNGLLLPTGRAAVDCDLNAFDDTTITTDLGPWEDWTIGISDPPLYDLDLSEDWPDGIEIDLDTGWGPGGVEFENLTFTDPGWGDWSWNPDTSEWEGGTGDPPPTPDNPPEDGWSGGDAGLDGGDGGDGSGEGYTASVGFTEPFVIYTRGDHYTALEPDYVEVKFRVTVDNPPIRGALNLTVIDGTFTSVEGQFGQEVGGGSAWTLTIPEGETQSSEITINASTNDGLGDAAITGCVTRALQFVSWAGGGYRDQPSDPNADPPTEFVPAMDLSATQGFDVCAYSGTVTWGPLGIWSWDAAESEWDWAGDELSDWEWNVVDQEWDYTGDEEDWTWDGSTREWTYTGIEDPAPAEPALPPPQPATEPPGGGYTTLVVHAIVDNPPVMDPLLLDLVGGTVDEDGNYEIDLGVQYGTLEIPTMPILFGLGWRWIAATGDWQRLSTPPEWRWHSQLAQWQRLVDDGWGWNTADEEFIWQGDGPEPINPPAEPPQQGGSTLPPDPAQWTLEEGVWTAPISGGYALGGAAPDAGPYEGFKTLHFLN